MTFKQNYDILTDVKNIITCDCHPASNFLIQLLRVQRNGYYMVLKLKENIDLNLVKQDLVIRLLEGSLENHYSFEINLIYKIIHEYSNYEEIQWGLYSHDKIIFEKEMKSLLLSISSLDSKLTWDCQSVLKRYSNLYSERNVMSKRYIRSNL